MQKHEIEVLEKQFNFNMNIIKEINAFTKSYRIRYAIGQLDNLCKKLNKPKHIIEEIQSIISTMNTNKPEQLKVSSNKKVDTDVFDKIVKELKKKEINIPLINK